MDFDETDPKLRGERERDREPTHINFVSGNPFVEVTKGILHLYKEKYVDLITIKLVLCQIIESFRT